MKDIVIVKIMILQPTQIIKSRVNMAINYSNVRTKTIHLKEDAFSHVFFYSGRKLIRGE